MTVHDEEGYRESRRRLEAAILDADAKIEPRDATEILTHWVVVYSFTKVDDKPGRDSTQVASIRSDNLSYWQTGGLLQAEATTAFEEPWRDEE